MRKHEMVYVFGNPSGSGKTYNSQKTTGHKPFYAKEHKTPKVNVYGKASVGCSSSDGSRYPTSIQQFAYDKKKLHRTQKPVAMCEWLIKTYSNEGETVLDFCCGSGSTLVAAKNTGREFIGIEMDEEIFKIAEERLNI